MLHLPYLLLTLVLNNCLVCLVLLSMCTSKLAIFLGAVDVEDFLLQSMEMCTTMQRGSVLNSSGDQTLNIAIPNSLTLTSSQRHALHQ